MRLRPRRGAEEPVADSSGLPLDAAGPWDVAEVDDPAEGRVDLGGLLVRPRDGVELRLQADQASGALVSIMLAAHDGAVELRPFASAKDVNQWDLAREEIAEQFRRQGSTVTEGSGEYGTELHIGQPVDVRGKKMIQPVRMAAVRGPRWVLRLTFYGTYATDPAPDSELIGALRDTVVVRGTGPIPPGEAIPLRLPPGVDLGNATVQPG